MNCKICSSEMEHNRAYVWWCPMCGYEWEIDPVMGGVSILNEGDFKK